MERQAGCSLEDLRLFVIDKFKTVGKDAMDLEVRAAARINEVLARAGEVAAKVTQSEPLLTVFAY